MGGPRPNDAIYNEPLFDGVLFGGLGAVPGLLRGGVFLLGDLFGTGVRAGTEATVETAASSGVSELSAILQRAGGAVGDQEIQASSRAVAEQAAQDWVGAGARDIVDRQTGEAVGKISADGTKIARFTSADKAQPYINLVNKLTGGNLHVGF